MHASILKADRLKEKFEARIDPVHVGGTVVGEDKVVFVVESDMHPFVEDDVYASTGCQTKVAAAFIGRV